MLIKQQPGKVELALSVNELKLGRSGGTHDISEWYDPTDAWKGLQKNLLVMRNM